MRRNTHDTKAVVQDSALQITSLNIEGKVKTNYSLAHVHGNLIPACISTEEVLLYYLIKSWASQKFILDSLMNY